MDITLVDLEPMRVTGYAVEGTAEQLADKVPDAWQRLETALDGVALVETDLRYGVFEIASVDAGTITYRYWVTAKVSEPETAPGEMATRDVAGGRYALVRVTGSREAIDQAYMTLGKWMRDEGIKPPPGGVTIEGYDLNRQSVLPPYETYDYVVFQALPPELPPHIA